MNNNVNLGTNSIDKYETIKCTYCGHLAFRNVIVIKRVPGVVLGQGTEDQYVPLQVYACDKCGKLWEADAGALGLLEDDKNNKKEEQKESLFKL